MNKDSIKIEEGFHDSWAASTDVQQIMVDEFFEAATAPENRFILEKLQSLEGKKVLDLGCGLGESSVYLAKQGAIVTATDLSSGMLEATMRLAERYDVSITPIKSTADTIAVPDESFDVVYAANLLHHVDIAETLEEVRRVLKPGGVFASWDPLAHNPVINVYRRMATEVRTEDEHPLTMKDTKLFHRYFKKVDFHFTWFFTLWLFLRFYLIERVDPNKERYWKKIYKEHKRLEQTYNKLYKLDRIMLRWLPFMKRYCWNIVVFATK
ncbi:class I SAM-dependent methyltransferase [Nitrospirota bacterium]